MASSRLGVHLKSARERAGLSREALAYHSGLSWAAIAQIESGRRQEVRASSLMALARALGVSTDYLVGSAATVSPQSLRHRLLIYSSDAEYMASAGSFLVEGVRRSECVLAVTARRQMDRLQDALGDDALHVEFVDSAEWYRFPDGALTRYHRFVAERFELGARWIRILGEPVWEGRSATEISVWTRYESMINLSLASSPATIVCPYDARTVPDAALAGARRTHPELADAGATITSADYRAPEDFLLTLT